MSVDVRVGGDGPMGRARLGFRPILLACLGFSVLFVGVLLAKLGVLPAGAAQGEAPPAKVEKPDKPASSDKNPTDAGDDADDEVDNEETAKDPAGDNAALLPHPFPRRFPAPELTGGKEWLNVGGPIELKQLRGKFVLLDFWTYCCINCMHILPELKKLEAEFPNELVVIGVHSAKFDEEKVAGNITGAIMRYEILHPVINDADHVVWDNFQVTSWPSLRVIDPEGNLVDGYSGEIDFESLKAFFDKILPYYRQRGLLDETPIRFDLAAYTSLQTPLRYPGKVLADADSQRLFIADSNHNRIVVAGLDGKLIDVIGSGGVGLADGDYATATFNHPQGMALRGQTLYVADTENHLLRKIDLENEQVTTIAGVGKQHRGYWPGLDENARELPERFVGQPLATGLNSPWDLWIHGDSLYIAMAGPHQIWRMPIEETEIGPFAGNGREDIVDGDLLPPQPYQEGFASFAQPSGLASDGKYLYVADSEGSSIRAVPFDARGAVTTVVGTSDLPGGRLFHFGDKDGERNDVLLQHCLGVVWHDDRLYVADTYNNKIKIVDRARRSSHTLVGTGKPGAGDDPAEFDEPAGISVAGNVLYVADTNNHVIRTIDLANDNRVATLVIQGLDPPQEPVQPEVAHPEPKAEPIAVERTTVRPSGQTVSLKVRLVLPPGYKLNPLATQRYRLEAEGDAGPVDRQAIGKAVKVDPPGTEFEISVPLAETTGSDTVLATVMYYYCQEGAEGLCKAARAVWRAPIDLDADAAAESVTLEVIAE